jgi:hypothetical protein
MTKNFFWIEPKIITYKTNQNNNPKLRIEWSALVKGKFQCQVIIILVYGILWRIWMARNQLIFHEELRIVIQFWS